MVHSNTDPAPTISNFSAFANAQRIVSGSFDVAHYSGQVKKLKVHVVEKNWNKAIGTYNRLQATGTKTFSFDASRWTGEIIKLKIEVFSPNGTQTNPPPQISVKISANKLVPPTISKVKQASATSIKISWSAINGATSYKVYRGSTLKQTVSSGTTWTEIELTTGQTYSYTIEACDAGGCSQKSNANSVTLQPNPSKPLTQQWARLLGSADNDDAIGVTVDGSGNIYVSGASYGNFDGHRNAGRNDMLLVKYNSAGTQQWARLFGSDAWDGANEVTVDASGNIYVAGSSYGNFAGQSNAGRNDMLLVKYNIRRNATMGAAVRV